MLYEVITSTRSSPRKRKSAPSRKTKKKIPKTKMMALIPHSLIVRGGIDGPTITPLPGAGLLPALLTLGQLEIGYYARRKKLDLVHDPTVITSYSIHYTKLYE